VFVLFDLDGTLVDSGPAHLRAAEKAFRDRGLATDEAGLVRFLLAHDAASAGMPPDLYYEIWRQMQPLYRLEQDSIPAFAGVEHLLQALPSLGIEAGLVTSKRRWAVERELERLGWQQHFRCVVCREDTHRHKPNPEPLLHAMQKVDRLPVAYVGDAPSDVQAAKAAGVPAIGAGWGWAGGQALSAAGADWVLGEPLAILPLLQAIEAPGREEADA